MKREDTRPEQYLYWKQLMSHLGGREDVFFSDKFVYPRQLEIHLPGDHKRACDLACSHCAGKFFKKDLGAWELDGLELLNKLEGRIPYHIYGGSYTEPIINPYYLTFLATTKRHGNHFGIHTSGTLLNILEEKQGWLTELNRISTDSVDYLSVSIDAGVPSDWVVNKGAKDEGVYYDVLKGIMKATNIRAKSGKGHAIRLCYLISNTCNSDENFKRIVMFAKASGVDSLRFSIPFAHYNRNFDSVRAYKKDIELVGDQLYYKRLLPYLSKNKSDRPYIFYVGPEFTDIDRFTFKKCIYGYYQITLGADGYMYKCSTTATPTAKHCRLGKITPYPRDFEIAIDKNYNPDWDCEKMCFNSKLRCNRMGMEINSVYEIIKEDK